MAAIHHHITLQAAADPSLGSVAESTCCYCGRPSFMRVPVAAPDAAQEDDDDDENYADDSLGDELSIDDDEPTPKISFF